MATTGWVLNTPPAAAPPGSVWNPSFDAVPAVTLNDELKIIKRINEEQNVQLGLTINWGRSAIEGRKIDEPVNHVAYASHCGVLSGVMFSGVASNEKSLYGAWRDLHAPPQKAFDIQHYENSSLMSYDNIRNTMNSCEIKEIDYVGIKLLPLPSELPSSVVTRKSSPAPSQSLAVMIGVCTRIKFRS
mgnify:CR=1 FL=1